MAINVVWQDERGEQLAECPVVWEHRIGRSAFVPGSHCLQYIDPVGDATFNQLQLPQLIREMEEAVRQLDSSGFKSRAEQVLEFVRGCVGIHTYVKFIGD
jgi:hypothetical protein